MKIVDLHVHSNKSDGSLSPTELVALAVKKGLSAFALTDHDTTDGLEEAINAAEEYNTSLLKGETSGTPLEVIPGIEFSTEYLGKDIHIVGLFIEYDSPVFKTRIQEFVDSRILRNKKMCQGLSCAGIDITYEKLLEEFPCCVITRSHYAKYLLNHGYVSSMAEAFERYIGDRAPYFVPREKITPMQAIELINNTGGIAILAHPLLYGFGDEQLEKLVKSLKAAGLTGLEAVYCTYSKSDEQKMRRLATKYDLLISGGSDFHGTIKPGLELATGYGNLTINENILNSLRETLIKKSTVNNTINNSCNNDCTITIDNTETSSMISERPKIFFTDLDSTLLTDDKVISPLTFSLLKEWCSRGNYLVLCSGRALDSIIHVYEQLNINFPNVYLVGSNGGEIYDCFTSTLLFRNTLPLDIIPEIFSTAREYNIHIQTYTRTHIVTNAHTEELDYYKKAIHTPVIYTDNVLSVLSEAPCKCLAIELKDLNRLDNFKTASLQKFGNQISMIYSNPNYIEIIPANSGKGTSVSRLCQYLNIPIINSLAAGDEMNDISMLEAAGVGIAMINGQTSVKKAADIVTPADNNNDGLVPILKKYM